MKMLLMLTCMAVALVAGASVAHAGGNSAGAKACQKDGWKGYVRSDLRTQFKNEGDCVSYAAQGGVLVPIPNLASQPLCESFGGAFGSGPDNIGALSNPVLWVCNGQIVGPDFDIEAFIANEAIPLANACFADGGASFYWLVEFGSQSRGVSMTCYGPS